MSGGTEALRQSSTRQLWLGGRNHAAHPPPASAMHGPSHAGWPPDRESCQGIPLPQVHNGESEYHDASGNGGLSGRCRAAGYLPMFMLALTTGLRQGELIALKWSDLDIENWTLTIAENRAVVRRELVEYGSQTRTIALTPEVIDLLIREHDKHPSSPLMFMHPATLKPYSPQMVRRMHDEIIKEAGLDHIRFTDLRHTCAVLSLRNGMETKELARMLGHYRPSITRQNYEPYLPHKVQKDEDIPNEATQGELQQAANVLDTLLKF